MDLEFIGPNKHLNSKKTLFETTSNNNVLKNFIFPSNLRVLKKLPKK